MVLPAPNLDDRRFQDLVDDAKRLVQQHCPDWTDHNVSDPGVTLIETFAYMVDQLLYRLNRVPDRHFVKFLDLLGVRLFPPTAATAEVTFWLSAPQEATVVVPVNTKVATVRTDSEEAVAFLTTSPLELVPTELSALCTLPVGGEARTVHDDLVIGRGVVPFQTQPHPGDTLLIGLSVAAPRCAINLRFDCHIEGVGVDPTDPPWLWEAWNGTSWETCEIDEDGTGGFNKAGDVVIHLPPDHALGTIAGQSAGWLRVRLLEPVEGQPFYGESPRIQRLSAATVGGTMTASHAETVADELLGEAEGVPGQRFVLQRQPVALSPEPLVVEVSDGDGWQQWNQADNFADATATDQHFLIDATAGEIRLGPAVRLRDGTFRQYGAVPPKGSKVRLRSYRVGGGTKGNVAAHSIAILSTSVPFISSVINRHAATGGVDGESVDEARERGPIVLRTRNRAVTVEDYEQLAREAAPEVARVHCVPVLDGQGGQAVRLLVVPAAAEEAGGRLRFESLLPGEETLRRIATYLEERRVIGARIAVEPPSYIGVTVIARLRAHHRTDPRRLQADALAALYNYFHPVHGGSDGRGWPFGRDIHVGEVYSVLQPLKGVEFVEDARLYGADPVTGERFDPVTRLAVEPAALVFSYNHQVLVEAP
jgi:predicted phage baseplate assembly protein